LESGIKATLISTSAAAVKTVRGRGREVMRKNTNRGRWRLRNILKEPEFVNLLGPQESIPSLVGQYDNTI
jgi:hypothetical protein